MQAPLDASTTSLLAGFFTALSARPLCQHPARAMRARIIFSHFHPLRAGRFSDIIWNWRILAMAHAATAEVHKEVNVSHEPV